MNAKIIKVKIVKSRASYLWYRGNIGEVFEVYDNPDSNIYACVSEIHGSGILKDDAVIINEYDEMQEIYKKLQNIIQDHDVAIIWNQQVHQIPKKSKYVKIIDDKIVYYIRRDCFESNQFMPVNNQQLMLMSSFAVDIRTNSVLKCRESIETVFDRMAEI